MADKKIPKISIGITSMVVMLTILCLTIFSVLTLSTALSERDFSKKRAAAMEAYYTAEIECASFANSLGRLWQDGAGKERIASFALEKDAVLKETDEGMLVDYECQIDEGQSLMIEIQLGDRFEVLRWQVVSHAKWNPDTTIDVWDGEWVEFES